MTDAQQKADNSGYPARPFTMRGKLRKFFRTGPLYAWRFAGPGPERIAYEVVDFLPGDVARAREIYLGIFHFAAGRLETGTQSPFTIESAAPGWRMHLHSFEWLRHLTAAGDDLVSGNARALIDDWQQLYQYDMRSMPWQADITARRLNSMLRHAPMILKGSNQAFYRRFCGLIARHVRFLRSVVHHMEPGPHRLRVRISLMIASIAVPMSAKQKKRLESRLIQDVEAYLLSDGMPRTRNIDDGVHMALDLLTLVTVMAKASHPVPDALTRALDRVFPAIAAMRHLDGSIASFNGSGAVPKRHLDAVMKYDPTGGSIANLSTHGHYRRLQAGDTCIIADTGPLPQSPFDQHAMAGTSSFEMSSDGYRFIINAGPDIQQIAERGLMARASAAHTMAVFDNTSCAKFEAYTLDHDALLFAVKTGPSDVSSEVWNVDSWVGFQVGHNGYDKRGYAHDRGIRISEDGLTIEGFDRFTPAAKTKADADNLVVIRFHIDPDIQINRDTDSGQIFMWPKNGASVGWVFETRKATCQIEQSICFSREGGPRQTKAICIQFQPSTHDMLFWRLHKKRAL